MYQSTSWEIPFSKSLSKGGRDGPENSPISWASGPIHNIIWITFIQIFTKIFPYLKHKVPPGLITNLPWSPRLSYKYDTNILHEYAIRDNAGLPSIGLEKIYCYVPCKCAFYRLVYSQNSKLFSFTIRHNLPNFPAQPSVPRVDWLGMPIDQYEKI